MVRGALQNVDPMTERRRVVEKRAIIPPGALALTDTVDPVNLDEHIKDVEIPEAPEPSEDETKKRRVESVDESVDWFQRERSSIACLTTSSHEREVFEIDVGDPLEHEQSFCRN